MAITSQQYAVQGGGVKLYGTMVLKHQIHEDFTFAIGIRTSNDKTMAAQLIAGITVFVCENSMFSGEPIIWRKHTSNLDISAEIENGVERTIARFQSLDTRVAQMKSEKISVTEAKAF